MSFFDALISSNKRKQWSDLLVRLNYSNLQFGWNGFKSACLQRILATFKIVSLAHVFGYGGSIPSAGTNFSDKWNRFGTWQHLEINDPSQG